MLDALLGMLGLGDLLKEGLRAGAILYLVKTATGSVLMLASVGLLGFAWYKHRDQGSRFSLANLMGVLTAGFCCVLLLVGFVVWWTTEKPAGRPAAPGVQRAQSSQSEDKSAPPRENPLSRFTHRPPKPVVPEDGE